MIKIQVYFFRKFKSFLNKLRFLLLFILALVFIKYDLPYQFRPYYLVNYPSYVFIENNQSTLAAEQINVCNPFVENVNQFSVNLDGQTYPKIIPIYQNDSLNLTCLNASRKTKRILLWNKFVGEPLKYLDYNSKNAFEFSKCPVTNCELTDDRSLLNQSDYVLFHMRSRITEFPKWRFSNQRWIYVVYESPQYCPMCSKLDGLFNMSSTYRSDSDITNIYLSDAKIKWATNPNYNVNDYLLSNKPNFAVILASHCTDAAERLKVVDELKKYIQVDIYGKCSTNKCPENVDDCRKYLASQYKFYFAFENSVCNEYITEKFFDLFHLNVLPVVLGGADYTKYAPKSGFINALDYEDPKELADYLLYLSQNQTAYNEYFKWRKYITKDIHGPETNTYLCEMCIQLQLENFVGIQQKTFKDHAQKMELKENCKKLHILKDQENSKVKLVYSYSKNIQMNYFESL